MRLGNKEYKLIIAGTRGYKIKEEELGSFIGEKLPSLVLSGCSGKVDLAGEEWAIKNEVNIGYFPAMWTKFGLAAGPMRNREMASRATHLLAFWNGKSKGTANMIWEAAKKNLIIKIVAV